MNSGIELIAQERARQLAVEGFGPDHDARYTDGELCKAAIMYGSVPIVRLEGERQGKSQMAVEDFLQDAPAELWPWDAVWWKPGTNKQCLIKAGALIAAELDRIIAEEQHNG